MQSLCSIYKFQVTDLAGPAPDACYDSKSRVADVIMMMVKLAMWHARHVSLDLC